jgi:hypothetical protein
MNWINKAVEGAYEDICKYLGAGCVKDTICAPARPSTTDSS